MIRPVAGCEFGEGAAFGRPFFRSAALLAALFGVAACSSPEATEPAGASHRPVAQDSPTWRATEKAGGSGSSLAFSDASGEALRLSCVRSPATLFAYAERLQPIASEERFSLGLDDDPVVLVADLLGRVERGVEASAPLTAELAGRLQSAAAVGVSYGAQAIGPVPLAADPAAWDRFVATCREIAGLGR